MLEKSSLEPLAKADALAAFDALAEAESETHGVSKEEVHFHEVGALDSIVDTVGCALGLRALGIDAISLSPLPIGEGTFKCAHGIYPVPAPATARLLSRFNLPISYDVEQGEMLTPTATSLFAIWKKREIPKGSLLRASAVSFGTREMKRRPNILRASIFEYSDELACAASGDAARDYNVETVVELHTNIDDATGETLATAAAALFDLGALDVWFEQIQMKKGRPAFKLCALINEGLRKESLDVIFRNTGVLGVRETVKTRYALDRKLIDVTTCYGKARVKLGFSKSGAVTSIAPEFDDCQALAKSNDVPFLVVYREVLQQSREIENR